MNNREFLKILKKGFYPWQTMPGYSASLSGTPKDGITLVIYSDYPSFGDSRNKILHCGPKHFKKVLPAIRKVFRTFDAEPFEKVRDYFKEVDTVKKCFVLPDRQRVFPGDYVEITFSSCCGSEISCLMLVGQIYNKDSFSDTDGTFVRRGDIISIRKVTKEVRFREWDQKDVEHFLQSPYDEIREAAKNLIFGCYTKLDTVKAYDILIGEVPSGFVRFDSTKGEHTETHIVPTSIMQQGAA